TSSRVCARRSACNSLRACTTDRSGVRVRYGHASAADTGAGLYMIKLIPWQPRSIAWTIALGKHSSRPDERSRTTGVSRAGIARRRAAGGERAIARVALLHRERAAVA